MTTLEDFFFLNFKSVLLTPSTLIKYPISDCCLTSLSYLTLSFSLSFTYFYFSSSVILFHIWPISLKISLLATNPFVSLIFLDYSMLKNKNAVDCFFGLTTSSSTTGAGYTFSAFFEISAGFVFFDFPVTEAATFTCSCWKISLLSTPSAFTKNPLFSSAWHSCKFRSLSSFACCV